MKVQRYLSFVLVFVLFLSCVYSNVYAADENEYNLTGIQVSRETWLDGNKINYIYSYWYDGITATSTQSSAFTDELATSNSSITDMYIIRSSGTSSILSSGHKYTLNIEGLRHDFYASLSSGSSTVGSYYYALGQNVINSVYVKLYDMNWNEVDAFVADYEMISNYKEAPATVDMSINIPTLSDNVYYIQIEIYTNFSDYYKWSYSGTSTTLGTSLYADANSYALYNCYSYAGYSDGGISLVDYGYQNLEEDLGTIKDETIQIRGGILGIVDWLQNLFSSISVGFSDTVANGGDILDNIKEGFQNLTSSSNNLLDQFSNLGIDLYDRFSEPINEMLSVGKDMLSNGTGIISQLASIPDEIWNSASTGIQNFFVPSSDDLLACRDKFVTLLESRFGAAYEACTYVTDFLGKLEAKEEISVIDVPLVTLSLPGIGSESDVDFSFGGYQVDVVPDGLEHLVESLKWLTSVVCTCAFLNSMRDKIYYEFLGDK